MCWGVVGGGHSSDVCPVVQGYPGIPKAGNVCVCVTVLVRKGVSVEWTRSKNSVLMATLSSRNLTHTIPQPSLSVCVCVWLGRGDRSSLMNLPLVTRANVFEVNCFSEMAKWRDRNREREAKKERGEEEGVCTVL